MILEKGNKVLCVENNSTIRSLIINEVKSNGISFAQKLDSGVTKKFTLKKGTFTLLPNQLISEQESKTYENPEVKVGDEVQILHINHPNSFNKKYISEIGIVKRIAQNEREVHIAVDFGEDDYRRIGGDIVYPMFKIKGKVLGDLYLRDGSPEEVWADKDLVRIVPETIVEQKEKEVSPDLQLGDRIMTWDITPDAKPPGHIRGEDDYEPPSTFIATVIAVCEDCYNPKYENGIKYVVRIDDTGEEVGLYGGEIVEDQMSTKFSTEYTPITYEGRDKWIKLPKLDITEETDIFGQGLMDPIEPEEFEGTDEDWEELISGIEEPADEPEYEYEGGKTDPEKGFVAPSKEVTDNICKVKGFCEAQGPITFGQLKELVEEATSKRVQADLGRGAFKTLWRIVPFFIPQILLPAIGVTVTRAINKLVTPALKDTRGYKEWWGKAVLKAMDIAEGDYIPDIAMGDDPISKVFFISDGLLQMIKDKYKLKFARYVADVAASKPDNEPVPEWFVDNLLRDYLNQKFLLNPPLPIKQSTNDLEGIELKEQTEVEVVDDNIGGLDKKTGGYQENRKFTPQECKILKLLSNRFEFDELNSLVNEDSHALSGEFQDKWGDTMKLIGEPLGSQEAWGKSLRWAAWITDNYDYVSSTGDGFCDIEKPLIRYPSMYEIDGDDSGWERIYRTGVIDVPAFDSDDAYERAENHWFDYEPDMETSDYGDYESDDDLELQTPSHIKTLKEQQLPFNPDNKNIERDHPKGEPDWSIRRGRQHYAMNVEDIKSEPVTALNNYLVKNSPFNFLGFDYYLTAVPGRMPNQVNVDIFVPMLDTGYNADKLWTTRFSPVINLDIHDDEGPYLESTIEFLHQIRADEKWPEYYMYDEVRDEFPDQVKAYEERESDYINTPGVNYKNSWKKREDLLEEELVELGKLFGIEQILINRQPFYPWKRKKDSYGNEDIRPGETVPREYPRPLKEQEDNESEFKQVVQDVVYSVYPHIIENLGVPDEGIPGVELWVDIYARLSGIEDMRGEASDTTKAEYVDEDNMIYIYYPNMENVEDIIRSLLHEYTHSLQDPDRTAQRAGGYDYDPNEIEATEAESNWKDYLVHVQEDLMEQSTGEQPIFTKRFLTILNYFFTMNHIQNSSHFIPAFKREFRQVLDWLPGWLWMVLMHNKNVSGLSTIKDTLKGIKPEDWEFPSIWEYEISYWDDGYEGEEVEECNSDGRGEMTYEECEDCMRAIKDVEVEGGGTEEVECEEGDHPSYDDEDCYCDEYEPRRYTVWYNQTRYVEFLTLQPLENTDDSGYTYGYEDWDEIDMDIDYDKTLITKDQEDTDYDEPQLEEYNLENAGGVIGVDADEYDSSHVKKYMRNLVGWVLGTKERGEKLTEQFDMLSPKEMKIKDLTPQIFRVLDDNFSIEPNPEGDLNYTGEPMALYSYENRSFVPMEDIFNPINQMIDGGIPQEDIEVFVEIITNWINYNMSSPSETLNENVVINDDSGNYTEEDFSPFIDFVIEELGIETPIDVIIQSHIPNGTTAKYTKEPEDKIKVTVKNDGRKLVDMLRSIAHELVHHRQNEIGKVDYYEDKLGGIPNIGGEIEDEANAVAGQLIKKYAELQPGIYNESLIKEEKVVGFNEPSNNFVVIAGGPGAGKSFITKNLINLDNVKDFNVDQIRVMTAKKLWGDKWEENISTDTGYQKILDMTYTTSDPRNLTVKFLKQFLQQERNQPVNVVYDAGGGQEQVMKDVHQIAKDAGFNTTLVYVRTPLDVAQQRNQQRPRSLPNDMVAQYHQKVKDNMRNMIPIFDNVWTVDNKEVIDLSARPSDNIEKIK